MFYVYDAFDRRIQKNVDDNGDGTFDWGERYVYDATGGLEPVLFVFDEDGELKTRALTGPVVDQLFATETAAGDVLWALTDHLGTVRDIAVYNAGTGATTVVNHIRYNAFGEVTSETDPATGTTPTDPDVRIANLRTSFTGREWDADAALFYYRARWYDPRVGRFISEDPMGFAAGDVNLQRYVANSPTNLTDPSGEVVPIVAAAVLIGGVYILAAPSVAHAPGSEADVAAAPRIDAAQRDQNALLMASVVGAFLGPLGFVRLGIGAPGVSGYTLYGATAGFSSVLAPDIVAGLSGIEGGIQDFLHRPGEKALQYFIATATGGLLGLGLGLLAEGLPTRLAAAGAARAARTAPKGLPPLRQAYIGEVESLKGAAAQLRAAGKTPEEIARTLHQMRRDIGIKYKDLTPAEKLAEIHARNLEKYGDKLGPSIDYLRGQGKTWEEIIESASRTGGADLGLAK